MPVLLRIAIGWHFLYAGLWKLENRDFSSQGFLSQAKGPLADRFHALVPDWDGRQRLDPARKEQHLIRLDRYLADFRELYEPSQQQLAAAETITAARKADVEQFLAENQPAIDDWLHEHKRLDAARQQAARDVPFSQERIWGKQSELKAQADQWLAELDKIWDRFQNDLNGVLERDQRDRPAPRPPLTDTQKLDLLVTYSNIAIGACLMAGLFTRLASLGGALFLLSIVLAQPDWPGLYPPPHPSAGRSLIVNKEFVEMMALFFLATTRVGRWGGLDFYVHHLFVRPLFGGRKKP